MESQAAIGVQAWSRLCSGGVFIDALVMSVKRNSVLTHDVIGVPTEQQYHLYDDTAQAHSQLRVSLCSTPPIYAQHYVSREFVTAVIDLLSRAYSQPLLWCAALADLQLYHVMASFACCITSRAMQCIVCGACHSVTALKQD